MSGMSLVLYFLDYVCFLFLRLFFLSVFGVPQLMLLRQRTG
jgi:hypothetical protein